MKHIADIIERGIREHPELSVGMQTEGIEVRSVGNTLTLHETALIEAFNLKAAIEYVLKNMDNAKEALTGMPPRWARNFMSKLCRKICEKGMIFGVKIQKFSMY